MNTEEKKNREEEKSMSPDKAQQLGNDLACLAASIVEIAEELKAMYDFDHISIFHTDRGSEFANKAIDEVIDTFNIKRSLSKNVITSYSIHYTKLYDVLVG